MLTIYNPEEFIQALEESHKNNDNNAFLMLMNFLKNKIYHGDDLSFHHEIGGSWKFLGWSQKNINGGLLFDEKTKTWSSHT